MSRWAVVLSAPVRTAIGAFGRSLKETPAAALGATVIRAVLARWRDRTRSSDRRHRGGTDHARLLYSMKRDGIKRGVVTLCIGGGQGIALALEAI